MKTTIIIPTLLLLFFSVIISCKKDKPLTNEINVPQFHDCYNSQPHDSATIVNKLQGTWNWHASSCQAGYESASTEKIVKATFSSTGTFNVSQNSSVITQGNWKTRIIGSHDWPYDSTALELVIDMPSDYLSGLIYICGDQLLFSPPASDGCFILFKKE